MGWFGLSILVASISYLFYKHPPFATLAWLRRLRPQKQNVASKEKTEKTESPASNREPAGPDEPRQSPKIQNDEAMVTKAETDRKAMPPPPPPLKSIIFKPSSNSTPRASAKVHPPSVPSFSLSDGNEDAEPEAHSFPAANSAQRARGGTHPSAPSFPALNSAQRASGGSQSLYLKNASPQPGLMAPPPRAPLPNRGPPSSGNSLAPPPTHNAIPTKPRKKVLLTPGHSPLDWARLASSNANLRGVPPETPYLRVPPSLLKQFTGRKGKDAWTVLGGKVYNMSPYLPYHPGGEPELLKAAGRDGTKLFGQVHPWVNWEGMLESCLVGIAVEEGDVRANQLEEMD